MTFKSEHSINLPAFIKSKILRGEVYKEISPTFPETVIFEVYGNNATSTLLICFLISEYG